MSKTLFMMFVDFINFFANMGHPRSGMVKKKKKAVPWQKRKKKKTRTNNGSINIAVLPAVGVLIIMSGQVLLVPTTPYCSFKCTIHEWGGTLLESYRKKAFLVLINFVPPSLAA